LTRSADEERGEQCEHCVKHSGCRACRIVPNPLEVARGELSAVTGGDRPTRMSVVSVSRSGAAGLHGILSGCPAPRWARTAEASTPPSTYARPDERKIRTGRRIRGGAGPRSPRGLRGTGSSASAHASRLSASLLEAAWQPRLFTDTLTQPGKLARAEARSGARPCMVSRSDVALLIGANQRIQKISFTPPPPPPPPSSSRFPSCPPPPVRVSPLPPLPARSAP